MGGGQSIPRVEKKYTNPFARMALVDPEPPTTDVIFQDTLYNSLSTVIFSCEEDGEGIYNSIDNKIYKKLKVMPDTLQTITYPLLINATVQKTYGDNLKLYKILEYPQKCKITYLD